MDDDLIESLDIIEPPLKKFKNADQSPFSARSIDAHILNIPRDILSEILDRLDTKSIYFLTITCNYFKASNLWGLISKLDTEFTSKILLAITSVNIDKLTKLESLDLKHAVRKNYLSALLRLTNLMSLKIDSEYYHKRLITSVLSNFPLLRELTKRRNPDGLATCQGVFLTKLVASGWITFDAKCITQFHKLQIMELSNIQKFTHGNAITHLTCLTSLTLNVQLVSDVDFESLCCHTQLRHLSIHCGYDICVRSLTNLHVLTSLQCGYISTPVDWTKILAPLTALQHINIIRLATDSFSPQLGSTLTYLTFYRSHDLSPVLRLSSLQQLDINVPTSSDAYFKLSELTRLTKLSLWFSTAFGELTVSFPYWTILTHLSCLVLSGTIDGKLLEVTTQLMPSVQVLRNK
jgi:hypothetical protein